MFVIIRYFVFWWRIIFLKESTQLKYDAPSGKMKFSDAGKFPPYQLNATCSVYALYKKQEVLIVLISNNIIYIIIIICYANEIKVTVIVQWNAFNLASSYWNNCDNTRAHMHCNDRSWSLGWSHNNIYKYFYFFLFYIGTTLFAYLPIIYSCSSCSTICAVFLAIYR